MRPEFVYNARLGIPVPELDRYWEDYRDEDRAVILAEWEEIRGRIPDRIVQLERDIIARQSRLDKEDHFPTACRLNSEIAELASIINDLHIWYRTQQDIRSGPAHH
ncbi:hypothetical protein MJA45_19315 [Paenibacillus aurantius]|uniref:Uncharacterized protein n=1 Tax=Paenibacillus aurantius TaxID=2918900 RepID=A0AA96L9S1_9BACL|nr:hypothetical protein [Paenibacillus aurantius]WJH34547.1 hypothetical protein N6H14_32995 [Paenibacillus sp. CC-CFT747]WNQ09759.1 hypothetical protein MJA45_19315 [Paenibacillus aurantius]